MVELAVADVDGVDAPRAALQQAVGEAAGRGADVEADQAAGVDAEMLDGGRQLARVLLGLYPLSGS